MKRSQLGIGAIEIVLFFVIIGIVAGLGFYLYDQHQTNDQASKVHHTASTHKSMQSNLTETSASKTVADFYDKYSRLAPPGSADAREAFIKQYGTNQLLTYFKDNQHGADPIVCAQDIPDTVTISSSKVSQNTGTVVVDEVFGSSHVGVTATVVDQMGLKVDTIICSVPLPAGAP